MLLFFVHPESISFFLSLVPVLCSCGGIQLSIMIIIVTITIIVTMPSVYFLGTNHAPGSKVGTSNVLSTIGFFKKNRQKRYH